MKFLITNDDGFDGPGLAALYHALSSLGTVQVVAPSVCHSAKGHAVNTKSPIRVERRNVAPFGPIHIADASPADCVRVGLRAICDEPPDYVIAGINTGANLGVDLFYSGTAAAAREAAILGIPSIAVSRYLSPQCNVNWDNLASHTARILSLLTAEDHRLPSGQFWNVNFPALADDQHPEQIAFVPMNTRSHDVQFEVAESDGDVSHYRYTGDFRNRDKADGCDVSRIFQDQITATPIGLCNTVQNRHL
jgi:5'-nucleotidase